MVVVVPTVPLLLLLLSDVDDPEELPPEAELDVAPVGLVVSTVENCPEQFWNNRTRAPEQIAKIRFLFLLLDK